MGPGRRALAFIGIGLLIHLLLVAVYAWTAGRDHVAFRLDRELLSSEEPLALLFAGDSHTRNAVDDALIPGSLNLAVGGEHYLKTYYRLKWLLERTDRPIDTVVLPLETTSFTSWKADNFAPEYVWGRYVPLFELGMRKKQPWAYVGKVLKADVIPYAGEADTLAQYVTETAAFRTDPGLGTLAAVGAPVRRKVALEAAKRHFQGQVWDDPSLLWAFRSLLRLLDQRGIRVVLVSYPVAADYTRFADRSGARPFVREEVLPEFLADPDLLWLDFETTYRDRADVFFDADHLNTVGAAHFTRVLQAELRDRGVLRRRGR